MFMELFFVRNLQQQQLSCCDNYDNCQFAKNVFRCPFCYNIVWPTDIHMYTFVLFLCNMYSYV